MQINVCFGINDNYCQHCACTIASILYNSNPKDKYSFYIISDYISDMNKQKIKALNYLRKFDITYFEIDPSEYEHVNKQLGPSSCFRFKAFDLLNFDKVIYLDSDIIVRKDIAELYNTNVDGYYCAGAEDICNVILKKKYSLSPTTLYINSGVMLINLNYCREHNVSKHISEFIQHPADWDEKGFNWGDQDVINYLWQDKIKGVDIKWNCMYNYNNSYTDKEYYHRVAKDPSIFHYITTNKPWLPGMRPHLKSEYFKYLKMTPWFQDYMFEYQLNENSLILSKLDEIKALIISNNK